MSERKEIQCGIYHAAPSFRVVVVKKDYDHRKLIFVHSPESEVQPLNTPKAGSETGC